MKFLEFRSVSITQSGVKEGNNVVINIAHIVCVKEGVESTATITVLGLEKPIHVRNSYGEVKKELGLS